MIQLSRFHTSQPPTKPRAFGSSEIQLRTAGMSLNTANGRVAINKEMLNQKWTKGASSTLCATLDGTAASLLLQHPAAQEQVLNCTGAPTPQGDHA